MSYTSAKESIEQVKKQKNTINSKLDCVDLKLQSKSFYFKMMEVKKHLNNIPKTELKPSQIELIDNLEELNNLLALKFGVFLY